MTINGINGANTKMGQMGLNQAADSYSKNIQNQISNAQKQLQDISSNGEMTPEEKRKKRQEIQQQISDLNRQLRQHQMEQRKEKQQAKETSMDDMPGQTSRGGKSDAKSAGIPQASMTAMISADASIRQSKVQGSVAAKMKGRAGVLESEIRLDGMNGQNTAKKQEELADVKQTAMKATVSQMETLGKANDAIKEAAEADSRDNTASEAKKENAKENVSEAGQPGSVHAGSDEADKEAEVHAEQQSAVYPHVDVRL